MSDALIFFQVYLPHEYAYLFQNIIRYEAVKIRVLGCRKKKVCYKKYRTL